MPLVLFDAVGSEARRHAVAAALVETDEAPADGDDGLPVERAARPGQPPRVERRRIVSGELVDRRALPDDVRPLVGDERPAVHVEGRLVEVARNWARTVHDERFDAAQRTRARTTEGGAQQ